MSRRSRAHILVERRLRLARFLQSARSGRSVAAVLEYLAISRPTLYRDLAFLAEVGILIDAETVNGEKRYRVLGELPPSPGSSLRARALDVAIASLGPMRGSKLVAELDALRASLPRGGDRAPVVVAPALPVAAPAPLIATLERAIEECLELEIHYRGAKDSEGRARRLHALELRLVKAHLYLVAHEPSRSVTRTFKVSRIEQARTGKNFDPRRLPGKPRVAHSVVVWEAEPITVVTRLSPRVARFANEYPLIAAQTVTGEENGSVRITAVVAGEDEAMRWVLSWGRDAEVLAPPSLRARMRDELRAALEAYGPGPRRARLDRSGADQVVSRMVNGGRRSVSNRSF